MKKKAVVSLVLLLAVVGVFIAGYFLYSRARNKAVSVSFDENAYEIAPRQYLLKYIESLSPDTYDKNFSFGNVTLNGKKVYAVYYLPNNPDTVLNKIIKNYNHPEDSHDPWRPGILAFIKNSNSFSVIWESKEFFSAAGSVGRVEFKDIDNDGKDELVLTVGQGARLIPAVWIYKWDGKVFNLANPVPDKTTEEWMWDSEQMMAGDWVEFKDIDNNKILAVVTTNNKDEAHTFQNIYRFDGHHYFLSEMVPLSENGTYIQQVFRSVSSSQYRSEDMKFAQEAGMTSDEYGYKKFLDNPPQDSTTTIQGNTISLFWYPHDWNSSRDADVAAISNDHIVWHDQFGGFEEYRFVDIDSDGIPEIEVDSDGGGNRPGCFNSYYRWTGKTFKTIGFVDSFGGEENAGSCDSKSEWSSGGAGLHIASDTVTYTSYIWRYSYPELYNQYAFGNENLLLSDWPINARLCKEIEITYQYDKSKGQFTEVSHKTVDEQDVYQNGIIDSCY